MRSRFSKAFTLIELIVVIVVLGILATIAIVGYRAVIDQTNQRSVEEAARSFDRQINTMASFGQEEDLSNVDPRNTQLILDMLRGNVDPSLQIEDIPDSEVMTANLKASTLRVLIWNAGAGAGSGSWTRLCNGSPGSGTACNAEAAGLIADPLSSIDHGDLAPYEDASSVTVGEVCLVFRKNNASAFLQLANRANKKGDVGSSRADVCDGVYNEGPAPAAPNKDYYDLGDSAAPANDASWAKGD
jgi:hypothetical protein